MGRVPDGHILNCKDLVVRFGGVYALNSVAFSAEKNGINAVIGPNGAGKTTLLNVISGLIRSDRGTIELEGKEITEMPSHQRGKSGVVRTFQNLEIFTNMSVLENAMTGCHRRMDYSVFDSLVKTSRYWAAERFCRESAERELDFVGLLDQKEVQAQELPFGSQRLLELARALAAGPKLLLLDEPAAGLNIRETRRLGEIIRRIREERGITVVLVEHDMDLVMRISDRITVLNFGEVITEGTPLEVQKNPAVIEAYLGVEED